MIFGQSNFSDLLEINDYDFDLNREDDFIGQMYLANF